MKTFNLNCTPREDLGKKATKALRKQGLIPAVLYGNEPVKLPYTGTLKPGEKLVEIEGGMGIIVTDFTVSFDGVRKLIYTPDIHLVEIDWEDGRRNRAILKDIQFHPVTGAILHLDFREVFGDKPIVMNVPVELVGHAKGVKAGGQCRQAGAGSGDQGRRTDLRERGSDEPEERRGLRREDDACRSECRRCTDLRRRGRRAYRGRRGSGSRITTGRYHFVNIQGGGGCPCLAAHPSPFFVLQT